VGFRSWCPTTDALYATSAAAPPEDFVSFADNEMPTTSAETVYGHAETRRCILSLPLCRPRRHRFPSTPAGKATGKVSLGSGVERSSRIRPAEQGPERPASAWILRGREAGVNARLVSAGLSSSGAIEHTHWTSAASPDEVSPPAKYADRRGTIGRPLGETHFLCCLTDRTNCRIALPMADSCRRIPTSAPPARGRSQIA